MERVEMPDNLPVLHDGHVIKVSENILAEYVHTPESDGAPARRALRLTDRHGRGVCLEGHESFNMLRAIFDHMD